VGISISTPCSFTRRARAGVHSRPQLRGRRPGGIDLGDNIFYGHDLTLQVARADARPEGATVFAYHVNDPERYGVVEFDADGRAITSREAQAAALELRRDRTLLLRQPRARHRRVDQAFAEGELEITDVNNVYMRSVTCTSKSWAGHGLVGHRHA